MSSKLYDGFANNCYKIVSLILLQEIINDFVICNHGSGKLLIVENVASNHRFERMRIFTWGEEKCLSNF